MIMVARRSPRAFCHTVIFSSYIAAARRGAQRRLFLSRMFRETRT
jgi:hypothetical protein